MNCAGCPRRPRWNRWKGSRGEPDMPAVTISWERRPSALFLGLKKKMQDRDLPGAIKYCGCPAEEAYGGKVFMAPGGSV